MKMIWDDYAGTVLGTAAAAAVIGFTMSLLIPGGILYEVVRNFAECIC